MKTFESSCPKTNLETASFPKEVLKKCVLIGYREDGFYTLEEDQQKNHLVEKENRRNKTHPGLKSD